MVVAVTEKRGGRGEGRENPTETRRLPSHQGGCADNEKFIVERACKNKARGSIDVPLESDSDAFFDVGDKLREYQPPTHTYHKCCGRTRTRGHV